MFYSHLFVEKPLDLELQIVEGCGPSIKTPDNNFRLHFNDLETLNDFAQAMMGLAIQARAEGEK